MAKSPQRRRSAAADQPLEPQRTQRDQITWIVVLGDIGRSPRMQYHALSLASRPASEVHIVAYGGSAPLLALRCAPNVHFSTLPGPPQPRWVPRPLLLVLKVLHQVLWLLWVMLFRLPAPRSILLQNPPAIPTMAVCWLAAARHRATLVIDWHNLGYTILALSQGGRSSVLVRLAELYERSLGAAQGTRHLCVTHAMQQELHQGWAIEATVLHDRPPSFFQRTDVNAVHDLFGRLTPALATARHNDWLTPRLAPPSNAAAGGASSSQPVGWQSTGGHVPASSLSSSVLPPGAGASSTILTVMQASGTPTWRMDRPAIVVSSTSWTPDEDFSILLDAVLLYDSLAAKDPASPTLLLLITGRGPLKALYESRLSSLTLRTVAVRTLWLEAGDYPLLLGAADIGVSLHASSSGLDLPMKVVDMFGSGLPVCALRYNCIDELVEEGETGLLFSTAEQLANCLSQLLSGFPATPSKLLRHLQLQVAAKQQGLRWKENWDAIALPVLST